MHFMQSDKCSSHDGRSSVCRPQYCPFFTEILQHSTYELCSMSSEQRQNQLPFYMQHNHELSTLASFFHTGNTPFGWGKEEWIMQEAWLAFWVYHWWRWSVSDYFLLDINTACVWTRPHYQQRSERNIQASKKKYEAAALCALRSHWTKKAAAVG